MLEMIEYGNAAAQTVLVQMADEHSMELIEREIAGIKERTDADFLMRVFKIKRWNDELSPWKASAVFGKENFGEGAKDTLEEVLANCQGDGRTYYIGGYSLAGLFALWSAYQTDVFSAVAAASPSMWFPGFVEYMAEHEIKAGAVYLSLGDKEAKARNPVMATVADRINEAHELLQSRGIKCTLEWNEGNHFRDVDVRMIKAYSRLLR